MNTLDPRALGAPIPIEKCRELFRYDPTTGNIYRNVTMGVQPAGSKCGTRKPDYVYVMFHRKGILAHRLAWAIHYGHWPNRPIDHINYDRFDNRLVNLRLATIAENNRNRPKQSNNTSGFKGVTFHKGFGKYQAKIMAEKKRYSLGYFDSARDASIAYAAAAKILHGEYARTTVGGGNGR